MVEADVLKSQVASRSEIIRTPSSAMRKTIARRLVESKQTVPHFYLRRTVHTETLMTFLAGVLLEAPWTMAAARLFAAPAS